MSLARARSRAVRSGGERTNHEATAPPQSKPGDALNSRFWELDKVIVTNSSHSFDSNPRIKPRPDYQAVS